MADLRGDQMAATLAVNSSVSGYHGTSDRSVFGRGQRATPPSPLVESGEP